MNNFDHLDILGLPEYTNDNDLFINILQVLEYGEIIISILFY